ncbi:MAG: peroxiredoxin [Phenylobacterium sp.]
MTLKVGDTLPAANLIAGTSEGPKPTTVDEIFKGRKVAFFAVPGAFTPTCSAAHLPGYVAQADTIKAKGVDTIACLSVNDAFVMGAWGKAQNAEEILMLADGNADITKALGLVLDATGFGMGIRSQRFAMVVEDGVVKHLAVESGPGLDVSAAEKVMSVL